MLQHFNTDLKNLPSGYGRKYWRKKWRYLERIKVIKVTKFNCRKKLVGVTKFNENNPTGHRAKIFWNIQLSKFIFPRNLVKIKGLSRRQPNWTVSNIICIFKGRYLLYICKTGWDIWQRCSASDLTLHRTSNLTQNELELGKFNLIFQWRDKFANFLAVALEFGVLLRHLKIYWTSLPQTRKKC